MNFRIPLLAALALWLPAAAPVFSGEPLKPGAHSQLACAVCHDAKVLSEFNRLKKELGRDIDPGLGIVRQRLHLDEKDVMALHARCEACHKKEFADWASSGHAFTYALSFLDRRHNKVEPPNNDCLRCHAMFFDGLHEIRDMVKPLNTRGPWQLISKDLASHPAIPCLTCHQIHPAKWPVPPSTATEPGAITGDKTLSKAGFYDRRERTFFPLAQLPHPRIRDGDKPVEISKDQRIRVCYQCHAPSSPHQAGTSDDRTLRGVHAGMSCFDCHANHSMDARNACAACHPAISNCGLDVTRMDTTFRAKSSAHDIHNLACTDCHAKVPKAR